MYGNVWESFRRIREQSEAEEVEEEKSKKKTGCSSGSVVVDTALRYVYFPGNSKGNIMDVKGLWEKKNEWMFFFLKKRERE